MFSSTTSWALILVTSSSDVERTGCVIFACSSFLIAALVNLRFFLTITSPVFGCLMSPVARWPGRSSSSTDFSYLPFSPMVIVSVA